MKRPGLTLSLVLILVIALWAGAALAEDIMNVPTANQQNAGAVKLAYTSSDPHNPNPAAPSHINCYKAFIGLTDRLEVDARVIDPNHGVMAKTHWNATALLVKEDAEKPNVVLGVNDISQQYVYSAGPRAGRRAERAYFLASAKTVVNAPVRGQAPKFPLVRLHLSVGTKRHSGIFGGLQAKVTPKLGAVAFFFRDDVQFAPDDSGWVYGINYTEGPGWPTIQIGKCGRSDMICASYNFAAK